MAPKRIKRARTMNAEYSTNKDCINEVDVIDEDELIDCKIPKKKLTRNNPMELSEREEINLSDTDTTQSEEEATKQMIEIIDIAAEETVITESDGLKDTIVEKKESMSGLKDESDEIIIIGDSDMLDYQFCRDVNNNLKFKYELLEWCNLLKSNEETYPIAIPKSLVAKGEVECSSSSYDEISREDAIRSFSVSDRKDVILSILKSRYKLQQNTETIHLGFALFDRCLDEMVVEAPSLPDIAAVSLILASKANENPSLTFSDVIKANIVNQRSIKMLNKLEKIILNVIDFNLDISTPAKFANLFLVYLNASESKIHMTNYLLELSVLNISYRRFQSSEIAYAAVCLAFALECQVDETPINVYMDVEGSLLQMCRINKNRNRSIMNLLLYQYRNARCENNIVFYEYQRIMRQCVAVQSINMDFEQHIREYIF